MTKFNSFIFILLSISTNAFSNKVISISDSASKFDIFYKIKKNHRVVLKSIHVSDRINVNEYDIPISKSAIFRFNSYEFGEANLSLKDYDNDGVNELLITNINQITDDDGNQVIFKYNQSDKLYHEILNFKQLRSPQLYLGLNRIREFDFWGDYNLEKYYSIKNNSVTLDSTVVSKYTFNSKGVGIHHKVYSGNSNTEYITNEVENLSFNLDDTIETIPIKLTHKNFLLNLYFDTDKTLRYLIVRNSSKNDLLRLNCKSVGIYLPMYQVIYDSLKYIDKDYDFNSDGALDFVFPSTQYGDLYLFLIDTVSNQLFINPRIKICQGTFKKQDNKLTTRSATPCGTLPREFTNYTYLLNKGQLLLTNKTEVVEYRKRKKIFSLEKLYEFDGMNIKLLKTTNRKTKQRI